MIGIKRNVKKNFTARARILLGPAAWLVTGWMERRTEAVRRRNSAATEGGSSPTRYCATLGCPSTIGGKHMEMTATTADPEESPPHQFSLDFKGTSQ